MQDGAALAVVEHHVCPIGSLRAGALPGKRGTHRVRQAEQQQRLVNQMRAKIKPDAGALPGLFAPARTHLRAVAVEMRLQVHRLAHGTAGEHSLHGKEIAVPTPVLKNRQQTAGLLRHMGQMPRLGQRDGKGLVHHNVLAGAQCGFGQRRMAVVGGGNDDEVDIRLHRRRFGRANHSVRPIREHRVRAVRADHVQAQAGCGVDQRRVEQLARIAVAHQGNTQGSRWMW